MAGGAHVLGVGARLNVDGVTAAGAVNSALDAVIGAGVGHVKIAADPSDQPVGHQQIGVQSVVQPVFDTEVVGQVLEVRGGVAGEVVVRGALVVDERRVAAKEIARSDTHASVENLKINAIVRRAIEVVVGDGTAAAIDEADASAIVVEMVAGNRCRATIDVDADDIVVNGGRVTGDDRRGRGAVQRNARGRTANVIVAVDCDGHRFWPTLCDRAGAGDIDAEREVGDDVAGEHRRSRQVRTRIAVTIGEDAAVIRQKDTGPRAIQFGAAAS